MNFILLLKRGFLACKYLNIDFFLFLCVFVLVCYVLIIFVVFILYF